MLATPGAHDLADTERDPTDNPQAGGENAEHQMQGVVDLGGNKNLLMPAPGAVGAYFFFSHPAGKASSILTA
jgi:hypothetical protein